MKRKIGTAFGIIIFLAGVATIGGPYSWASVAALAAGAVVVKVAEV